MTSPMSNLRLSSALLLLLLTLTLQTTATDAETSVSASNYTVTEEAWFEVQITDIDGEGNNYTGRFVVALFGDTVPMTVMNFAAIARGYQRGNEPKLHYKNTTIHRIVKDFVVQMGDVSVRDGSGTRSIYGDTFVDENFYLSHRAPGWVAMANRGKDTNGSQFYILLSKARWLDNKHVVFGKVIRGFDTVRTIGEVPSDQDTAVPERIVTIVDCGLNKLHRKYELPEEDLDSTEDLYM